MLKEAYNWWIKYNPNPLRISQLDQVIKEITNDFNLEKIICIETGASQNWKDGCIGIFLAKLCELTNGQFYSVDNDKDIVNSSKKLYSELGFKQVKHYIENSKTFLQSTDIIPNLVHLDSWDLNLRNPFPSALHGWEEFIGIESKMPIGSILLIDDNFFQGTWVEWKNNKEHEKWDRLNIEYPIVGKGSHIYSFIEGGGSNWKKLSEDKIGTNVKLVYKKVKND